MSWSRNYRSLQAFQEDLPHQELSSNPESPEVQEQIVVARETASLIIKSKALGVRNVNVFLAGHANPRHEPMNGWANDTITVTVSQL